MSSMTAARLSCKLMNRSTAVRGGIFTIFSSNTKKLFSLHQSTKLNNNNINNTFNTIRHYHKNAIYNNNTEENVSTLEESEESIKKDRIRQLTDILELNPNFTPALLERALLFQELNDFTNSCIDLEKAIEIDPNIEELVDLHTQLGQMYSKMENSNEKSMLHLEKALELHFEANTIPSPTTFSLIYTLYYNNGQHEKSIKLLTRGINFLSSLEANLNEELAELYLLRGFCLISQFKMFERGNQDYEKSLQLVVHSKLYCLRLILKSYVNLNVFDDKILMYSNMAREIFTKFEAEKENQPEHDVAEFYTEYSKINIIMRNYYWKRKEFILAQQHAGDAIYKNDPENIRIDPMQHSDYRSICLLNGNFNESLSNMNFIYYMIARKTPYDLTFTGEDSELFGSEAFISYHIHMGFLYEMNAQTEVSIMCCERVKELLKDYKEDENITCIPKENLKTLYNMLEGYCNLHQGNHSLLKENTSHVVKHFPFYLFSIGEKYKKRKEYERSREYYLQYFNETDDIEGLSEAAECLFMLNRHQEVVEEFDRVLERDSSHIHALFIKGGSLFRLGKLESARESLDLAMMEAEKQNHPDLEIMINAVKLMWPQYCRNKSV